MINGPSFRVRSRRENVDIHVVDEDRAFVARHRARVILSRQRWLEMMTWSAKRVESRLRRTEHADIQVVFRLMEFIGKELRQMS